ncbi:MAG: DUF4115 domain-containing protein [Pseudomonadota bacterium]|nr:DUF4115 domain-containing protein [Pseudomonadota bacterium]
MKRVSPQDIENAATSLDTQCFRIYYHIPKDMHPESQRFQFSSPKEVNIKSMTQVSHLYSDPQEVDTEAQSAPLEDRQEDNMVDISTMKPGARLRQAREQKNISVQQVADKLYLDAGIIDALESDDYDSLPSPIFIRGYLRSYAKFLELPAESIVEAYELIGQQQPPPLTFQLKQNNQANSSDSWVKAITFMIIIVLMVLMAMWHLSPHSPLLPSSGETAETPNNETIALTENQQSMIPAPLRETPTPLTATEAPVAEFMPPAEENAHPQELPLSASVTPAEEATNEPPIAEETILTPALSASEMVTTETSEAETVATEPPSDDTLKLTLERDTWMRINDNTGKQLYNGIGKAGAHIELTGQPPFKLRLGHMMGITAEYQGKQTDLKNHPQRDGKNITIGAAE